MTAKRLAAAHSVQPPLSALRQHYATGELSCVAVADDCITRRKLLDPSLFAYHQFYDDRLRFSAQLADQHLARGGASAVCGIPFSVKNIMAVERYACYPGTRVAAASEWEKSGSVVAHLMEQGALLTGTTHASELAVGGLGVNQHWGTPRNPWDARQHRVPGGSSSGAAISVLEGACSFALGTDTGGSVRVPASAAGLVGLKTTSGRWPLTGVMPLASRFDSIGVIAAGVETVAEVFSCIDAIVGPGGVDLGVPVSRGLTDYRFLRASALCWQGLDPGIGEAVESALALIADRGAVIEDDNGLFAQAAVLREQGPNTAAIECNRMLDERLPGMRLHLSDHVAEFLKAAEGISDAVYRSRLDSLMQWRTEVGGRLGPQDIIVLPTLRETPPTLATLSQQDQYNHYSDSLLDNTVLGSICGLCGITLPVGLDAAGIPVGMQLLACAQQEKTLLHVAALVEAIVGDSAACCGYPPLIESLYNSPQTTSGLHT